MDFNVNNILKVSYTISGRTNIFLLDVVLKYKFERFIYRYSIINRALEDYVIEGTIDSYYSGNFKFIPPYDYINDNNFIYEISQLRIKLYDQYIKVLEVFKKVVKENFDFFISFSNIKNKRKGKIVLFYELDKTNLYLYEVDTDKLYGLESLYLFFKKIFNNIAPISSPQTFKTKKTRIIESILKKFGFESNNKKITTFISELKRNF